ncbi:Uncharacterized protein APZ42_024635 [Daphnia magna]|uniref:Uncharacterized protein n=1 Tax=Daphnia magna TaxID=35525 RepID=A0A164TVW6_9CRUS|nr:Uncharacterized protein APZ42_024635 [Daphnia magna]
MPVSRVFYRRNSNNKEKKKGRSRTIGYVTRTRMGCNNNRIFVVFMINDVYVCVGGCVPFNNNKKGIFFCVRCNNSLASPVTFLLFSI